MVTFMYTSAPQNVRPHGRNVKQTMKLHSKSFRQSVAKNYCVSVKVPNKIAAAT